MAICKWVTIIGNKWWLQNFISDETIEDSINECIEPAKDITDIRNEPYNLPGGYKWDTLDLKDPEVVWEYY